MSNTPASVTNTLNIKKDQWLSFLAEFTRMNRGAHATLEVLDCSIGRIVEVEGKPFEGIAADDKDGESNVWISFAGAPADLMEHGVRHVTAIRAIPADRKHAAAIEIEDRGGTRTLLTLRRPEDFALPAR
jgi:hypothetical protein